MRTTPRSGWVACIDPEESIALTMFDVAMLAAAPSTSLSVRWTWGVRYVALKRKSHPFTAPRPPGNLLYRLLVTSLYLSFSVSLSSLTSSLVSRTHTFAYAYRKSANAPDADVGPSLIPCFNAHDSVFGLNPLLRDERERGRYTTLSSSLYF